MRQPPESGKCKHGRAVDPSSGCTTTPHLAYRSVRRFRDAKFVAVVGAWMFHHVPEVGTALAECARARKVVAVLVAARAR